MLKSIELTNVGPIPDFHIELGSRLNVITGDNGLGKSFILDVVWFILTRCWPAAVNRNLTSGYMAKPVKSGQKAKIAFVSANQTRKEVIKEFDFDYEMQTWRIPGGRPINPGVVVYAHIDGSFSVWDPHKNYWGRKDGNQIEEDTPAAFVFSPHDVWYGLNSDDGTIRYCNGLLQDLYDWQKDQDWKIDIFNNLLKQLSPPESALTLGTPAKLSVKDARKVPTVSMPYGEVSILVAAAGIKRILALAYFLTWTMVEHKENSQLLGKKPATQITFIMDEIESHLHPKWQREILGSIMNAFEDQKVQNIMDSAPAVQIVLATHSPLVMASLEPFFDHKRDQWFDINMNCNHQVEITAQHFEIMGDVDNWLTGEAFDLSSSLSPEAESALKEYEKLMEANTPTSDRAVRQVIKRLSHLLPETDSFWRMVDFK